jgi:hypothetical protein
MYSDHYSNDTYTMINIPSVIFLQNMLDKIIDLKFNMRKTTLILMLPRLKEMIIINSN